MGKNVISVSIVNETGSAISGIDYSHRYDEDVYETGHLDALSETEEKTIGVATFWTGFMRTGKDYWWIQFKCNGKKYTCKANFYCNLTSDDAEQKSKGVKLKVSTSEMKVIPPVSSNCSVRLYESDELFQIVSEEYKASGLNTDKKVEDKSKKCGSCN